MKIASLVFSTEQGLGYLARDFYDNGLIDIPIVVYHPHRENHPEWFDEGLVTVRPASKATIRSRLRKADVVLFFETPFDWSLIGWCREQGIKTVLMVMHECTPKTLPARPDLILSPSALDHREFPGGEYIPVPVPRSITWRQRTVVNTFVHNAGHGGLNGRNGTQQVLEAILLADCFKGTSGNANIIIRCQDQHILNGSPFRGDLGGRVRWEIGGTKREDLYADGDVFLFPEGFNGLSLPLQEAYASGMLIMAGARFPMTEWLPTTPLIKVDHYTRDQVGPAYREFDHAQYSPQEIATTMDMWYGKNIEQYSVLGRGWAEANSWDVLKPKYLELLGGL